MTEMIYGVPSRAMDDPIIPRWWRNVDRWSLIAVFVLFFIGLLLGMAASPPLAESNQKPHFYYVYRQAFFWNNFIIAYGFYFNDAIDYGKTPLIIWFCNWYNINHVTPYFRD
jgi:cell division protein FtsW (lipid II flippase)